jgi:hypothetical protein
MTRHEELLSEALEYLYDLQSERAWKKDEVVFLLGKEYDDLSIIINEIQELTEQVIIPDDFL